MSPTSPRFSRRHFLQWLSRLALTGVAGSVGVYGYGFHLEPQWISVERVSIPLAQLPAGLAGLRVVQLSDWHIGPTARAHLQAAVAQANALQPDLIVLTGDYVYHTADAIFDLAPVLAGLNARYGVFGILGNHDYWTDAAIVQQGLAQAGITLLVNTGQMLSINQAPLYLAGFDDGWSTFTAHQPDVTAALANHTGDAPVIVLMHEPDYADTWANDPRLSLQLSGHSHGGQVRLPWLGAPLLPRYGKKYNMGLYRAQNLWVYTNRGIGHINPPVRFNCRPEITEITLVEG